MLYYNDMPYSDSFVCDGEIDFHDYYYINPVPAAVDSVFYTIHRTGIETKSPTLLEVSRKSYFQFHEIFCIFSGKGELLFRDNIYELRGGQIVILPAGEAHAYRSNPDDPLGVSWLEFCGGDSNLLIRRLAEQGPIIEGSVVSDILSVMSTIQQKLMLDEKANLSCEIYRILFLLLQNQEQKPEHFASDMQKHLLRAETYIEAHISETISNLQLAKVCGMSLSYFLQQFPLIYHCTPQLYVLTRKINRSKLLLLQSDKSVSEIADHLGFCNSSHFIRRFRALEGVTPKCYRELYSSFRTK